LSYALESWKKPNEVAATSQKELRSSEIILALKINDVFYLIGSLQELWQ
jgi:hypothetical protein